MSGGTWTAWTAWPRLFYGSARLQTRAERSPVLLVQGVVQPAVFAALTLLAGSSARALRPGLTTGQVLVGVGLVSLWGVAVWQAGLVLRKEIWQGTLAVLLSVPVPLPVVVLGKTVGTTVRSALLTCATIAAVGYATGSPPRIRDPLLFAAAAVCALLSACAMGLLLAGLFVVSRAAVRIAEALGYPVFILGGLLVPLTMLPAALRPLSAGVALRWAGDVLDHAMAGTPAPATDWLWLTLTSAAYLGAGLYALRRAVRRIRKEATLELH